MANDINGLRDVFVRDRRRHVTRLISVAHDGGPANNISLDAAMSADGLHVAFSSWASNLVAGDTNSAGNVFVRDLTW